MMNVLLVHNYYGSGSPSGENHVFDIESRLLTQKKHRVYKYTCHSDTLRGKGIIGAIIGGILSPWNPYHALRIRNVIANKHPVVVHIHNTFPLLSPSILYSIGNKSATVVTLHNYRIFCPAAIPMRNDKICTSCIDKRSVWDSLRYGCYRNSRLATLPLAFSVYLHRLLCTWTNKVDAFIVLSQFQKEVMVNAGLPSHKVHVKPNFIFNQHQSIVPWSNRRDCVVYVGRLSVEKGIFTLLSAWRKWGSHAPELRIVGDGPLRKQLELLAADLNVTFLGHLNIDEVQNEISHAKLLVLPSECYETFGLSVIESFSNGTPVLVSRIGALQSIVSNNINGVLFENKNHDDLLRKITNIWSDQHALNTMGNEAYKTYLALYDENVNYDALMTIYNSAIKQLNNDRL